MKAAFSTLILCLITSASCLAHDKHHAHGNLEITNPDQVPELTLTVTPDTMSGWNLHFTATNFEFAPQLVNQTDQPGKGHAHIYIDDKKIARLYGNWYHFGDLDKGKHQVRVSLNSNKHNALFYKGKPLAIEVEIEQK